MRSFLTTAAIFFGICFIYILIMLSSTENYFTYILDDAYIHLAVAKHFAINGVWGITKYALSSTSSSPVFTLIISALISVFGDHALILLIFNLAISGLLIFFLSKYYSLFLPDNRSIIMASLFSLFTAVLHVQVMSGMEHVLQVFVIAVNIYYFQKWYQNNFKIGFDAYGFYFTILLLGLVRFESMFYFLSFAFVFLLIKKIKEAALVLVLGFVPILIFGYFNYSNSGYFLPNSVILKGPLLDFSGNIFKQLIELFFDRVIANRKFYKIGLFPLLACLFFIFKDYKKKENFQKIILNNFLPVVWIFAFFMHCMFSRLLEIYRYEAYLLMAFAMIFIPRVKVFFTNPVSSFRSEKIAGSLLIINLLLLINKSVYGHIMITGGTTNIYEQQIQSARFLKKYYNDSKVVANDIGAICYFTDIHLLDFMGLGSNNVVPYRIKTKKPGDVFYDFLARYSGDNKYELAIAYDEWLDCRAPKSWKKVAYLELNEENVVLAQTNLFIYSIDPGSRESLIQNIKKFNWNKNVKVKILE